MKKENIDFFICPDCKGELKYVENENILLCMGCGGKYPIIDGIPILLPKEEKDALHAPRFNDEHK